MNYKPDLIQLLEALKSLPSPSGGKGYVDYQNIDGNHVHVIHKHKRDGKYSSSLQVNGRHIDDATVGYHTRVKILGFLKHSTEDFVKTVRPNKITAISNSRKKQQAYERWGNKVGTTSTGAKRVTIKINNKKEEHVPSQPTKRNIKDPYYQFTRKSGKINKHLGLAAFVTGLTK